MDKSKQSSQALWKYVRQYLTVYLPRLRGRSPRTVGSYRQSIAMYCQCLKDAGGISFANISFDHITRDSVMNFIQWQQNRDCSTSTCNLRLLFPQVLSQVLCR